MRSTLKVALVATALSGILPVAGKADAAQIFRQFTATGSNFALLFGSGANPAVDPLTFVFTVNFDNSANITQGTTGLTVQSDPLGMPHSFGYAASTDSLTFAPFTGPNSCGFTTGQACTFIGNASGATPFIFAFNQSQGPETSQSVWRARTLALSFRDIAVPEPNTWAMMILGFGAMGAMVRRRRRIIALA